MQTYQVWSGREKRFLTVVDKSEVDTRISALEQRLIACETALLMAAAGSVPDTAAYMAQYPEPYSAS